LKLFLGSSNPEAGMGNARTITGWKINQFCLKFVPLPSKRK